MATVTAEEVSATGGGVCVMIAVSGGTESEVESLFEGLFRHLRKFADLPGTAGNMGLTTRNDASGDDSSYRPLEGLFFMGTLVDLFRYVTGRFGERELLTHGRDVSKGGEYFSFYS